VDGAKSATLKQQKGLPAISRQTSGAQEPVVKLGELAKIAQEEAIFRREPEPIFRSEARPGRPLIPEALIEQEAFNPRGQSEST